MDTKQLISGVLLLGALLVSGTSMAESKINVLLQEWRIITDVSRVKAGKVTFLVQNRGHEPHELVLLKTDLKAGQLPLNHKKGGINEDGAGTVIDEIEDILPKSKKTLSVTLKPGNYVLLCNMVEMEEGEREEHYGKGMRIALRVE